MESSGANEVSAYIEVVAKVNDVLRFTKEHMEVGKAVESAHNRKRKREEAEEAAGGAGMATKVVAAATDTATALVGMVAPSAAAGGAAGLASYVLLEASPRALGRVSAGPAAKTHRAASRGTCSIAHDNK